MMMNQVRLLSVVEWQVRRPGAVAQPVVAFQSWLPIGCHHQQPRPPKPTCLPLTDSRPLMAIICRHYRAAGAAEADTGRPAGAPLTDCAANDIPSALPRTLYSGQKNRLCFGLVSISASTSPLCFLCCFPTKSLVALRVSDQACGASFSLPDVVSGSD